MIKKLVSTVALAAVLFGCGDKVEIPTAHVGKIFGKTGYREGVLSTSKFRLPYCWSYCDKIILMDISDTSYTEKMKLFMPKDKLEMKFDIMFVLAPSPGQYDAVFNKVPSTEGVVSKRAVYNTYARQIIRTKAREILSVYSIAQVASSRQAINNLLKEELTVAIKDKTPFVLKQLGLADVDYPKIILTAQKKAAERREAINEEAASLQVSLARANRELKEAQATRKIEVEQARAEAEVNKILANSVTPAYVRYHKLKALHEIAKSPNKTFVPVGMLDSIAGQNLMAK